MKDRIREIIASKHLSDSEFADYVGLNRSTLSHCLNGRNDVSKDIITKIHNVYPYISINWLMFGEGKSGLDANIDVNTGLFESKEKNRTEIDGDTEYLKDFALKTPEIARNNTDIEPNNMYNNTLLNNAEIENKTKKERSIEKIILFYSDNTFDTFEKNR